MGLIPAAEAVLSDSKTALLRAVTAQFAPRPRPMVRARQAGRHLSPKSEPARSHEKLIWVKSGKALSVARAPGQTADW